MRRLVLLLAAIGLFSVTIGCKTTGKCDCAPDEELCCPPWSQGIDHQVMPSSEPPVEVLRPMPQKAEKKF